MRLRQGHGFREMGRSQDAIVGWKQFTEGMISKEILPLQEDYFLLGSATSTVNEWVQGPAIKLLEVTHGQWLCHNVHVHDATPGAGAEAMTRKEEIKKFIEDQMDLGGDGPDAMDHYLLYINLEDPENSTGEDQHYLSLQIMTAR